MSKASVMGDSLEEQIDGAPLLGIDTSVNNANCPTRFTTKLVGGKWKTVILYYLKAGPVHFGQMRRYIPNASHKVLIEQLRELEKDHLIHRKVIEGNVKRVEYSFTEYGRTLAPVLEALANWGTLYRNRYDGEGLSPHQP